MSYQGSVYGPALAAAAGFAGYPLLELLWRGYTHVSMAAAGAICVLGLYVLNACRPRPGIGLRCVIGGLYITAVEFLFGVIFNLWLGVGVWDYSDKAFHLLGQVCPENTLLWMFLSFPVYLLCDQIDRAGSFRRA